MRNIVGIAAVIAAVGFAPGGARAIGLLPDGRMVTPAGFTIPVEGFASSASMSPDGKWLAVLAQDGGAVDVLAVGEDAHLVERLSVPYASGMTWTADGVYVTRGYSGAISRFTYESALSEQSPAFAKRADVIVGGLLNGIAEDPATHRILVARTAEQEVDVIDDGTASIARRLTTSGQPFSVGLSGANIVATIYNSDHIDVFPATAQTPIRVATGPHPTALTIEGGAAFVSNADGHDVVQVDVAAHAVTRRFDLRVAADPYMGQTPSGVALSADGRMLFVTESGLDDLAVVDTASGHVVARIPTGWYPMAVVFRSAPTIDKDPRIKAQLWILSAQGYGSQPDPGSEWNGWYTGLVQHLLVEPNRFEEWTHTVALDDRLSAARPPHSVLPPVKHVVFIVKENKHFDEEFGDDPRANADPALLLYGRKYTPNAHALAERYTLFDDFMADGQSSDYGHAWVTQGIANDYLQRNNHTPDEPGKPDDRRVPNSIWPIGQGGEDSVAVADMNFDWFKDLPDLPKGPRVNVSAVFGPRGELIDELQRKGVSFRVYGEQMTVQADGLIAPGLRDHADSDYPGAHIDYGVLDTQRAKLFLDDVEAHGLAAYSYLTLPTDHTAGTKPGFFTPASYVANNDVALGEIVAGLSKRPDWRNTIVFVTMDDAQGTGDHVDSHRMPAFAIGPYIRRSYVDHTHYDTASILRTVETLYGLQPLTMYDAGATPMIGAFATRPDVSIYTALPSNISMLKNPGSVTSLVFDLDGPDSAAIPSQEWISLKGSSNR